MMRKIQSKIFSHLSYLKFYENKTIPSLIITNFDVNEKSLLERLFLTKKISKL